MRKHYIDNIRSLTIVLVVIYHVIYMFSSVAEAGVIGPVTKLHGQDAVQYLLYPWFMVILFIISGMCAKYYLHQHSDREFVKARTRKLLVPSTIGLFVFGWIQGYFNMAINDAFHTIPDTLPGFIKYLIMVISGTGVLWTIQVMWILSMLLLPIRKLEKGRLYQLGGKAGIIWLILMGIPLWGAAQILNTPVVMVYRFGIYGLAFLLGYYVFSHDNVINKLKQFAVPLLAAAITLGISYTLLYYGENYAVEPYVNCPLAIAYTWTACLAILGAAKRWADRAYPVTDFLTKQSFGLYVFHYLPLSACAWFLTRHYNLSGLVIYLLTGISAFAGGLLLNAVISRIPFIRWCVLGIKSSKKKEWIQL